MRQKHENKKTNQVFEKDQKALKIGDSKILKKACFANKVLKSLYGQKSK